MADWPHQIFAADEAWDYWQRGANQVCITSPTGTGKTRIVEKIIEWGYPTLVLCHRSMLLEQWAKGFDKNGMPFGMQAAGYAPGNVDNLQLGMLQTISRRWEIHGEEPPEVDILIIDEIHAFTGPSIQRLIELYVERGTYVILVTATPIGIGHLAEELITAAVTSDGRKCGALLPARIVPPSEPDARAFKNKTAAGLLQFEDSVKEVMLKVICGDVLKHYAILNPEQKPAILFAPGVPESRWFTEQFMAAGIPWSHIDSKVIILNGEVMNANRANRERLLEASRTGETKGISNRFVLREGIDAPWLYHAIFACTMGGLSGWLQSAGRLLRYFPGLLEVLIQDHGGNYWRHGSPNADREWILGETDKQIADKRKAAMENKTEREPVICPKCMTVRADGAVCPKCGFAYKGKRRIVIQTDGTLKEVYGDIFKPRKVSTDPEAHKSWKECYYRCKNAGKTFSQAKGLFMKLNRGEVPGPDFPLVPLSMGDWAMPVKDVPKERLTGYGQGDGPESPR